MNTPPNDTPLPTVADDAPGAVEAATIEARIANALDAMPPRAAERTEIDVPVPLPVLRGLLAAWRRAVWASADADQVREDNHADLDAARAVIGAALASLDERGALGGEARRILADYKSTLPAGGVR